MKPFALDREAALSDLQLIEAKLRMEKERTRSVRGPSKVSVYTRNGHKVRRVVPGDIIRQGYNFTEEEGKRYHALQKQATLLCTALALSRPGNRRVHNSPFLHHPEGLLDLVAMMRVYEQKAEEVPAATEAEQVVQQQVQVMAGGAA